MCPFSPPYSTTKTAYGISNHYGIALTYNVKLVGVLTQSRVLDFIQKHASFWADSAEFKTVTAGALLMGKSDNLRSSVESCLVTDPTWRAFRQINHKEISALAVKDERDKLVGCLSVSDLRVMLRTHNFPFS